MKTVKHASTLSSEVVKYLMAEGYRQKDIAAILHVDSSFICHVVKGKRNFTLDHLERLAKAEDKTLPELLALATPMASVPRKLREGYELFLKGLRDLSRLRARIEPENAEEHTAVAV